MMRAAKKSFMRPEGHGVASPDPSSVGRQLHVLWLLGQERWNSFRSDVTGFGKMAITQAESAPERPPFLFLFSFRHQIDSLDIIMEEFRTFVEVA
ncbi:hypothetical protein CEXT_34231 [Caerostris extrusa]|uniref:Uncharacterized protein n=1 Tax=Caerostris extrusa TaxID=172846 RepID=A0AAV4PHL6_CAEEX|nr:hypothetical protein CEXT_34231 [Caerostris extrusa]